MANINIGKCITPRIPTEYIVKVTVPAGGLFAGQVVNVATLDNTICGNYEVFEADIPSAINLNEKTFALVMNDGFETLNDGRRPSGDPDYTSATYEFQEGQEATVVFLDNHLMFEIGVDSVAGGNKNMPSINIGSYLVPEIGTYTLSVATARTAHCLRIIGVRNYQLGGNNSGEYAKTYICVGCKGVGAEPIPTMFDSVKVGDRIDIVFFNGDKSVDYMNNWLASLEYDESEEYPKALMVGLGGDYDINAFNYNGTYILSIGDLEEPVFIGEDIEDVGEAGWIEKSSDIGSEIRTVTSVYSGSSSVPNWNGEIIGTK